MPINDTLNFQINEEPASPNLCRLFVRRPFDRELNASVTVNFTCSDNGSPPRENSCLIPFKIVDVNDNEPRFERSAIELSVSEAVAVSEPVCEVVTADRDEGENAELTYALLSLCQPSATSGSCAVEDSAHFSIEPATGRILARSTLDRETQDRHQFLVTAADRAREPRTAMATVNVIIIDSTTARRRSCWQVGITCSR